MHRIAKNPERFSKDREAGLQKDKGYHLNLRRYPFQVRLG
jgi:hypothetical protein